MCRAGQASRAVRSADSAGGISARRREVKMSARLAVCRVGRERNIGARASHAGTPSVLPLRRSVVMGGGGVVSRGAMCGVRWEAVSSLRERLERENVVGGLVEADISGG